MMIVFGIMLFSVVTAAKAAPVFPEPALYISPDVFNANDSHNILYNGWRHTTDTTGGISFSHLNREWGYQWFIGSFSLKTDYGLVGIGVSHYTGNGLPVVKKTDNGIVYVESEASDAFTSAYILIEPNHQHHRMTVIIGGKKRALHHIFADAFSVDIHASSRQVLNHRLGVKTTNLLATDYGWSTGKNEALAKYIGLYYIHKYQRLMSVIEYNYCLNYSDENNMTGHIAYAIDSYLRLFLTMRNAETIRSIGYGARVTLTSDFFLDYAISNESTDYASESYHSVGIGLLF